MLLRDLVLPDFRDYAVAVKEPGAHISEPTRVLGGMLRDVMAAQRAAAQLPLVRPGRDRVQPARAPCWRSPARTWQEQTIDVDQHLAPDGRVMEMLSEHTCQGWLEGYLLTGRHGLFSCYEAFIHIVDSMFNQHAKWLKVSRGTCPGGARSPR